MGFPLRRVRLICNPVFLAQHAQIRARLALFIGKDAGSFELMIGDGLHHAGDGHVDSLLCFDHLSRQTARGSGCNGRFARRLRGQSRASSSCDETGDFAKREANAASPALRAMITA